MWAAVELAKQRQQLFEEDRSGANALSRGKGKKKKTEAAEASEAGFNYPSCFLPVDQRYADMFDLFIKFNFLVSYWI